MICTRVFDGVEIDLDWQPPAEALDEDVRAEESPAGCPPLSRTATTTLTTSRPSAARR